MYKKNLNCAALLFKFKKFHWIFCFIFLNEMYYILDSKWNDKYITIFYESFKFELRQYLSKLLKFENYFE